MDQCRIGRAAIGLSEAELARVAGVPADAVSTLEAGLSVDETIASRILAAFAAAGVSFHATSEGAGQMRVRTLDGIIEAPVRLSKGQ